VYFSFRVEVKYAEIVPLVNRILDEYAMPLTVRQIFYRLVSPPYQAFENTQNNYKSLDRILTRARERGEINWRRIEDRARETIGGDFGYGSPSDWLKSRLSYFDANYYTKPMWDAQPELVEVWVEKDALSRLCSEVARGYNVLVFPSRGYSSFTKVKEAIEDRFNGVDKPVVILHFADHDPSGLDITDDLERRFHRYGAENVILERVALTIDQVRQHKLAPNPTKKADPIAEWYIQRYGDQCWELDALDPRELQKVIREAIARHIDRETWDERLREIERDREELKKRVDELRRFLEEKIT